jgi:hypothetical protein
MPEAASTARFRLYAWLALCLLLGACATFTAPTESGSPEPAAVQSKTQDDVTVSAAILSDAQATQRYGVDLGSRHIQAVWLRIENRSAQPLWLLVSALDASYYTAAEAAFAFRGGMAAKDAERMEQHFRANSLPLRIRPGQSNEGYVLTPRVEGGRYLDVELSGRGTLLRFGFAITLPDGDFEYEHIDPMAIYPEEKLPDLDDAQLRAALEVLPCCTSNADGSAYGDPLNIVLIGSRDEVLTALARSGWSFTHRMSMKTVMREIGAVITGAEYPTALVSPLHVFGRPQDFTMQRARKTISQRNHMRLWLAPFHHAGRSVWVGQISRDIGVKVTTKSPTLTTHVIGPDLDDAREYLLQSLMVRNGVARFGFARGVEAAPMDQPRVNLTGDPYFTDGLRLVVILASDPVPPHEAHNLHWEEPVDPAPGDWPRAGATTPAVSPAR